MEKRLNELKNKIIKKKILPVILGPTASGKTALALNLSKHLEIEIISADSRQIFKFLDIGTAKPTNIELSRVKHHFIDILNPNEYYSAGLFEKQSLICINEIFNKNKIPVIVGGSGLYIDAICNGFFNEYENIDFSIERTKILHKIEENGVDNLYEELAKIDIESAELYNDKNPRRIIRALEFYYTTGILFSEAKKVIPIKRNFELIYFGIKHDREFLYKKINNRVEQMWADGLLKETKKILEKGYSADLNSLNTVGYKECILYLNNQLTELEAINQIKQNTRRYAKRQMTWFNKIDNVNWLDFTNQNLVQEILKILNINYD